MLRVSFNEHLWLTTKEILGSIQQKRKKLKNHQIQDNQTGKEG